MIDPTEESPEEFTPTRDHEYQGAHYHDQEAEIVADEEVPHAAPAPANPKQRRRPPPRPHYDEE